MKSRRLSSCFLLWPLRHLRSSVLSLAGLHLPTMSASSLRLFDMRTACLQYDAEDVPRDEELCQGTATNY